MKKTGAKNKALSVQHVSLQYGEFQALKEISFDVMPGERIAIVGANGAGKSSLFDVLTGFCPPTAGELWLGDTKLNQQSLQKRARLGLMRSFQRSRLFEKMTVLENLQCAAFMKHTSFWQRYAFWQSMACRQGQGQRLMQVAKDMGLAHVLHEKAHTLSYASQRLLELGMMLVADAKIILLDEPTAGLNEDEAGLFLEQLKACLHGKTLLFIEHDRAIVKSLADRVLVLQQGSIQSDTLLKDGEDACI